MMRARVISLTLMFVAMAAAENTASAFTYQIADGIVEVIYAPVNGRGMAWLNSFQVQPGAETLTSINLLTSGLVVDPITVHIWTDPTNDGNPADAVVARTAATSLGLGNVTVPITPITLPAGSWFFAGGFYAAPTELPISPHVVLVDQTDPDFPNRSFLAHWNDSTTADLNNLSAATIFFGPEADGNYLVSVNAVPEPSTVTLAILSAAGFAARRRFRR